MAEENQMEEGKEENQEEGEEQNQEKKVGEEEEATKNMRLRPSMGSIKLTMQLDLTDC